MPASHYLFSVGRVNRVSKDRAAFMKPACEESIFSYSSTFKRGQEEFFLWMKSGRVLY